MKVYGLTGGIGMGKSTSGNLLADKGIKVVDTDMIARDLVEPGQPALLEIRDEFGDDIMTPDGHLRRKELANLIFNNPVARKRLEQILHPRIRNIWQGQVEQWRANGEGAAVVIIPLLFETEASPQFDEIICLACTRTTQNARLLARGWDKNQVKQRIAAQWPIDKKMELSRRIVWTEGSLDSHQDQLKKIFG